VERLLSFFMLSDAPGKFLDVAESPEDAPLEGELIASEGPVLFMELEGGTGWLLELGLPVAAGVISSAMAGAAAKRAATAAITINFFIGFSMLGSCEENRPGMPAVPSQHPAIFFR
jgi:hypothetical protein